MLILACNWNIEDNIITFVSKGKICHMPYQNIIPIPSPDDTFIIIDDKKDMICFSDRFMCILRKKINHPIEKINANPPFIYDNAIRNFVNGISYKSIIHSRYVILATNIADFITDKNTNISNDWLFNHNDGVENICKNNDRIEINYIWSGVGEMGLDTDNLANALQIKLIYRNNIYLLYDISVTSTMETLMNLKIIVTMTMKKLVDCQLDKLIIIGNNTITINNFLIDNYQLDEVYDGLKRVLYEKGKTCKIKLEKNKYIYDTVIQDKWCFIL